MTDDDLPSRAKPESLHTVCSFLRSNDQQPKTELYENLSIDRRQIRASIEYGVILGFLTLEDDVTSVTRNGHTLGFTDSIESDTAKSLFKDAIENYAPYRDALLWVHEYGSTEEIKSAQCITQSTFKMAIERITGQKYKNRVINLLLKTCVAAGLGNFVTGRKGLETRLKLSEEYNVFIEYLMQNYSSPVKTGESDVEDRSDEDETEDERNEPSGNQTSAASPGGVKIQVEWDVSDMSQEEIGSLVAEVRELGGKLNVR